MTGLSHHKSFSSPEERTIEPQDSPGVTLFGSPGANLLNPASVSVWPEKGNRKCKKVVNDVIAVLIKFLLFFNFPSYYLGLGLMQKAQDDRYPN